MRFNYTLDSPSPVLEYTGSWSPVSSADGAPQYSNGTGMQTSTIGDMIQFTFNGTGIWVYGAQKSTHGRYSIIVDTSTYQQTGRTAAGQDEFQQLLFGTGNLTSGPHEITITNEGFQNGASALFDLDYIVWEGSLPDESEAQTFTSQDAGFEYLPGPTWWSWGQDNNSLSSVLYYTQSSSAEFRFNFTGQSVALYGYLDSNHGNFSCSIDGVSRGMYSGYYPNKAYQQLICFGDNLDNNNHILTVDNIPASANNGWFSIDYAQVRGSHVSRAVSKSKGSKVGSIVGGVIGGIVGLILIAGLLVFLLRRRRRISEQRDGRRASHPIPHRDVFEIDPRRTDAVVMEEQSNFHNHHVTPYDAYSGYHGSVAPSNAPASPNPFATPPEIAFPPSNRGDRSPSTIAPSDSQSQAQSDFLHAHEPPPPLPSSNHLQAGALPSKQRHQRVTSDASAVSSRYRAPQPEQDAGPLLPLGESDESLSDDESRAVAGPTLPPVYSSIAGPSFQRQNQALTPGRNEKAPARGALHVVGPSSDAEDEGR